MRKESGKLICSRVEQELSPSLDLETPIQSIANTLQSSAAHLTINAFLNFGQNKSEVVVMIDSGATGNFIDSKYCNILQIPQERKSRHETVRAVDGTLLTSGPITHHTKELILSCPQDKHLHQERIRFKVIDAPQFGIILGMPWLTTHNPLIDWYKRALSFTCE